MPSGDEREQGLRGGGRGGRLTPPETGGGGPESEQEVSGDETELDTSEDRHLSHHRYAWPLRLKPQHLHTEPPPEATLSQLRIYWQKCNHIKT